MSLDRRQFFKALAAVVAAPAAAVAALSSPPRPSLTRQFGAHGVKLSDFTDEVASGTFDCDLRKYPQWKSGVNEVDPMYEVISRAAKNMAQVEYRAFCGV